jgi:outer membrane protein TolC
VGQNEQRDEYGYSFGLRQPLFNGSNGSYLHSPRANSARVNASEEELRATRQTVALETKTRCYDLLKAQKLAEVQERAVQRSIEQLETSQARYELGSASMSDFLKSKVQLGNDSLTLITRQNAIEIARAELNNYLALDVERPTEVDVELEFAPYPLPTADAITQAVANHPTVRARAYDLKRWGFELGNTQSTRLPTISLTASYGWVGTQFPNSLDEVTQSDTYSYGINISWRIFTGFSTSANVNQAKVAKHVAESELAQARRDVRLGIKTASLGVTEAGKRFRVAEDQVESAQEDLDIAQEKYNLGAATILDILVAQVNLSSAETDRIQAGYDWLLAIADLERSMGGGD